MAGESESSLYPDAMLHIDYRTRIKEAGGLRTVIVIKIRFVEEGETGGFGVSNE